jgi:hypothetical protein
MKTLAPLCIFRTRLTLKLPDRQHAGFLDDAVADSDLSNEDARPAGSSSGFGCEALDCEAEAHVAPIGLPLSCNIGR